MNAIIIDVINCIFCWSIVGLSVTGYLLTLKRTGERWLFWVVLAIGWAFLAIIETSIAAGINMDRIQITTIWLSSFLLVMASLLILFLKFIQIKSKIQ